MIYAVDRYTDVLKVKDKEETVPSFGGKREPKHHYFNTEEEARTFLIRRARIKLENSEAELRAAKRRLQKCERKFGLNASHAASNGEQK